MPFPHGESYEQVAVRRRIFLEELAAERDGQQVLLIRHHATLWMLITGCGMGRWKPQWVCFLDGRGIWVRTLAVSAADKRPVPGRAP